MRTDSDAFEQPSLGRTGSSGMPDFRQSIKAQLQKTKDEMPQGLMREVMETYKPHILSRRRRLIEDCVRDLRLNNDHIHIIEQEMRLSLQVRRLFVAIFKHCANLHQGITTFLSLVTSSFSRFHSNFLARTK